jgi:hypothetical protein
VKLGRHQAGRESGRSTLAVNVENGKLVRLLSLAPYFPGPPN